MSAFKPTARTIVTPASNGGPRAVAQLVQILQDHPQLQWMARLFSDGDGDVQVKIQTVQDGADLDDVLDKYADFLSARHGRRWHAMWFGGCDGPDSDWYSFEETNMSRLNDEDRVRRFRCL